VSAVAAAAVVLVLGVAAVILLGHAPSRPGTPAPLVRAFVAAGHGMVLLVVISPSALWLADVDLPVARPAEPWRDGGMGCGGGGPDWTVLVALYLVIRLGPAALGAIIGAIRSSTTVPDATRPMKVMRVAFIAALALALARCAVGGVSREQFTTYGATTPPGASGWRLDLQLARLGERKPIPERGVIERELEHHSGSHMPPAHGSFTSARDGLQAWVADEPVLFYVDHDELVGARVAHRNPQMIPHERRPHFSAWPEVARADDRELAIIGPADGGGTLVVRVSDSSGDVYASTEHEAWPFVAPPWVPVLVGMMLGGVAFALQRWTLLATWIYLEATAVLLYGVARYLW
jgi:hypothetical protein